MDHTIEKINSTIKYSFYVIFFLVPLAMWPSTYELFEFNKMWVVFIMTTLIFCLWSVKMVLSGKIEIRRTPLDIPLVLFLISQIISTIVSIDQHTSIWGYYSRFNGGLLSTISYIFLYYAFASNLIAKTDDERQSSKPISYKMVIVSLLSGLAVTLWGIPSHFGYDPTCFMFRGTLDVACWTDAFQPKLRIFSTLGQPNWLGTFLAILIPIAMGLGLYKIRDNSKKLIAPSLLIGLTFLFFLALNYTGSQSSFVGLAIGIAIFLAIFIFTLLRKTEKDFGELLTLKKSRFIIGILFVFALTVFIVGTPIGTINKFATFNGLKNLTARTEVKVPQKAVKTESSFSDSPTIELGGTQSSQIRLIVWRGAIELFKQKPIFGYGVETYAYAYYLVKPLEHNLTSEWDYLYNKAHNEYLNYLATTGIVGLTTYLAFIGLFIFLAVRSILKNSTNPYTPISYGIVAGITSLLVSNFFGFSVVILNLLLFLLPLMFFDLQNNKTLKKSIVLLDKGSSSDGLTIGRMALLLVIGIITLYFEFSLVNFWEADKKYALGYNLNKAGEFSQAYTALTDAVKMSPNQDLYRDELSINLATLAVVFAQQGQATQAAELGTQASALSDDIYQKNPNNISFLKTRTRVAFALSQLEPSYIDRALEAITKARALAPTDAKLAYNMALFYNQKGDNDKSLKLFSEALKLKPNYIDAYYARALMYTQLAKDDVARSQEYKSLARKDLEFILSNLDSKNTAVKELLKDL